jgi:adenylate cyclase class 2
MSQSGLEIEAKYHVSDIRKMTARLHTLEARLIQPRVLEINVRFDLPDGSLRAGGRVLRLRRDTETRLTYKGAGQNQEGVLARQEIEMVVEDFERARELLEALGYRQSMVYEKYRTTYQLDQALVMLDELPYGDFVEVEAESATQVQAVTARLGLNQAAAIAASYVALFENIRSVLNLRFPDCTFDNFAGIPLTSGHLDVPEADQGT